ncbi:MAG: hypothetical protein U9R74_00390 [Pseudomonadota bacterium]|nr:hypothetical protein [Pseudomonadota bacterium]
MIKRRLGEQYTPLYFLAALGAGGMAVTFFLYLMFMVDHAGMPMVTFDHLYPLLVGENVVVASLVGAGMVFILAFALLHYRLLLWNILEYRRFRKTDRFLEVRASNDEITLMAIPLTLAMSINVSFIVGAVFVPGLWAYVETLFPFAIAAFLAVGAYALKIFTEYLSRVFTNGDFDFDRNNHLGQMVGIFAFAMVAVGLAAPGAMSHHIEVNATGMFFAILFTSIATVLGVIKLVLGFKFMFRMGISEVASPSLWLPIPILTLMGITLVRLNFGLDHGFNEPVSKPDLFVLTSTVISLQVLFGVVGYAVMKRLGYFREYVRGDKSHVGSYSLICPGVALFVFGMFFVNFGLVHNGLLDRFSVAYFVMLAPLVFLQIKTLATLLTLNRKLLRAQSIPAAQPVSA